MKLYTTRFLKLVAACYMGFPVLYLLIAALLFNVPVRKFPTILLSPSFYLISAVAIAAGYGLYEMKRWSWYVFLLSNVLAGYLNAVVASQYSNSDYRVAAFVISVLALIFIMLRVASEVRVPYFLPKIRWWESNPRYRLVIPVTLRRDGGAQELQGEILDLSMGGCFIKVREPIPANETMGLSFSVFGQEVACVGTVVWRTQSAVTHPQGIGIKFNPFTRAQKKVFKAINQRLKEIATLYRQSRYLMNQEEFFKKMEALQNSKIDARP